MFQLEKLKNPPTTSKLGVRPSDFKFILGYAVFVVGYFKSFVLCVTKIKTPQKLQSRMQSIL